MTLTKAETKCGAITDSDKASIRKGAVLRWKFRLKDGNGHIVKQRLDSNSVGWHPNNRNGKAPQPLRCQELTADIMGKYDPEEADHKSVAVEENPATPTRFLKHTRRVCAAHDCLAGPNKNVMAAASVGHSHLNQAHRNVLNRAIAHEKRLEKIKDTEGRLSIQMLQGVDSAMAEHIQQGIYWEILSFELEIQHPVDGVSCVQASLNDPQAVAMTKYEMQAIAHMETTILPSIPESAEGGSQTIQTNMAQVEIWRKQTADAGFADLALSEHFSDVCNLVVSTCQGPWLQKMVDWHDVFINSKQRRITYATLAGLSFIPLDKPRCRHCMFTKAFDKKPTTEGVFCNVISGPQLKALALPKHSEALQKAEKILNLINEEYATLGAYADMKDLAIKEMLLWVDIALGDALMGSNPEKQMKQLNDAETAVKLHVRESLSPKGRSVLPGPNTPVPSPVRSGVFVPGPAIIGYNKKGAPLQSSQPCAVVAQEPVVTLQWAETLDNIDKKGKRKLAVFDALTAAYPLLPDQAKFLVVQGRGCKGPVEVKAAMEIPQSELILLPLPQDSNQVSDKPGTGMFPGVQVPESVPPIYVNSSVKRTSDTKKNFMPPFWLIRRSHVQAEANVHIKQCRFSTIDSIKINGYDDAGTGSNVRFVSIPVMSNAESIKQGDELVMYIPKPQKNENIAKTKCWTASGPGK